MRRGPPAFGRATRGTSAWGRMARTMRSACSGPWPQFTPMASAPSAHSRSATCSGVEPRSVRSSNVNVAVTITARSHVLRAAARACSTSFRSDWVSISTTSTPEPESAAICSANASNASAGRTLPYGARRTRSGPTEPATSAPVSRAISTPLEFSSATRSGAPAWARANRLAPNVLVATMRAPASTNDRWTPATRSGESAFRARSSSQGRTALHQRRPHPPVHQQEFGFEQPSKRRSVHAELWQTEPGRGPVTPDGRRSA